MQTEVTIIETPGLGDRSYLFRPGDIHQAADAAGRTVSLHLLAGGGPHPVQHCPEPASAA